MGTRCKTIVYDFTNRPLVGIYRHHDGYISGHGAYLAGFLDQRVVLNGYCSPDDDTKVSNGAEELAAHLVLDLKSQFKSGEIYLFPLRPEGYMGEEYLYEIYEGCVRVFTVHGACRKEQIFSGTWEEFIAYVTSELDTMYKL